MYGAKIGLFDQTKPHDPDDPFGEYQEQDSDHSEQSSSASAKENADLDLAVEEKEGWHG